MSNLILVIFVFVIGFGWGAAAMLVPTYKKLKEVAAFQLDCLNLLERVIKGQEKATTALKMVSNDCVDVIGSTKNVIESVDKLIEEIGNEI